MSTPTVAWCIEQDGRSATKPGSLRIRRAERQRDAGQRPNRLQTNVDGLFAAPALLPGQGYSVNVTAPGFAPYDAKDIDLQVGQSLNLTVTLALGQTSTSVEVGAVAQLLEDTEADVDTPALQC